MTDYVKKESIAFIILKNPPVNSLSLQVRIDLLKYLDEALEDPDVKAIVIKGDGNTFCAGADIAEFKTGVVFENFIPFVINDIEQSTKPVFALIHGNAFGGGFELALGCHYRIASSRAFFSLPEVKLGILPAGGGSQRLPRLIGSWHAIEMICSAQRINSADAFSKGILDLVVPVSPDASVGEEMAILERETVKYVLNNLNGDLAMRRICNKKVEPLGNFFYGQFKSKIAKSAKGMLAPVKTFELIKNSAGLTFEKGLELEQKTLAELMNSGQSEALQYLFFAERNTAKIGIKNQKILPIKTVGIIGAGTMGSGITINFLNSGFNVVLIEQTEKNLTRGVKTIESIYKSKVKKQKITPFQMKEKMALLKPSTDYDNLKNADLVIEAVFENLKIKQDVMKKLDSICKSDAILCTNTSTLNIDKIASSTNRPEKMIGMHFFAPANVMKLLENVKGEKTSDETIFNVMKISKLIKKTPVLVGNCFGFVANRTFLSYTNQAFSLIFEGALPSQIDNALEKFGFAMGPFKVADLSGIDIVYHIYSSYKNSIEENGEKMPEIIERLNSVMIKLYDLKRFGVKTGKGFYDYSDKRRPKEDQFVTNLILETSKNQNFTRREISNEEIVERCLLAAVNESFKCLEEGISAKPSDIDVIWIFGFGFPPYRGGPMFYADKMEIKNVLKKINDYFKACPENPNWRPSALMEEIAKKGTSLQEFYRRRMRARG